MSGSPIGFIQKQNIKHHANKSLKWLFKNLDAFEIKSQMYEASPWQVKPIAELVFILSILHKHNVVTKQTKAMTKLVIGQIHKFDWHELAAYDPCAATIMFALKEFCEMTGQEIPWDERYADVLQYSDYYDAMDRVPYREMEYLYGLASINQEKPTDTELMAQWFADTTFGLNQQHVRYTIDDMYSLTHALFYITKLGTRPIEEVLDEQTCERVRNTLVTLAVVIARADNVDVLGEILLCWIWTGVEMTPVNQVIFKKLLKHVTLYSVDDGAIAPYYRVYQLGLNSQATFLDLYHTTMVSMILFTMVNEKL